MIKEVFIGYVLLVILLVLRIYNELKNKRK
nr:MAG TPA: hypothetical protein [Caudoviricetes sp.]